MSIVIAILLGVYAFLATVHIYLQSQEYKELQDTNNEILDKWDRSIDIHLERVEKLEKERRDEKQDYWITINELELENKKLKAIIEKHEKENVPRETSYNQSFGMPEVVDYFDQQYAREDTKRG